MRTCPECGEDTKAGMTEPCTKCGFSPLGDQALEEAPATVSTPETEPQPETTSPSSPKRKNLLARPISIVVIVAAAIGIEALGVFDTPNGPEADDVEASIVASAAGLGASVSVECPDDAEDTEVGDSFECVVTSTDGERITLTIHNNEDEYTWNTRPLARLR